MSDISTAKKGEKVRNFIIFLLMLVSYTEIFSADISGYQGIDYTSLKISGNIVPGDETQIESHLRNLKSGGQLIVSVDSSGGDVFTAMKIGRILRSREAHISTSYCLSSCVLVLISGVHRRVYTYKNRGVGLHRMYFERLPDNISLAEIAGKRQEMISNVATYMREMNISNRLLDVMEAIPPEKIKMLTREEVENFGLDAPDPVWDEKNVANLATFYRINSAEYRRRTINAELKCPYPDVSIPSIKHSQEHIDCLESVLYGIRFSDYIDRNKKYNKWKDRAINLLGKPNSIKEREFFKQCQIRIMLDDDLDQCKI